MDDEAAAPPLAGRRVRLRSVYPSDYEFLYALETAPQIAWRWRYRGATPSLDAFVQALWQQTLVQFVVEHKDTKQQLGHVIAFDANERNGWCHIGIVLDPGLSHSGWAFESLILFINYLFPVFNLRKLYGEMLEPAYADIASGANKWFRVEGRLTDHEYFGDRYWDLVLVAVHRDDWEREGRPYAEMVAHHPGAGTV